MTVKDPFSLVVSRARRANGIQMTGLTGRNDLARRKQSRGRMIPARQGPKNLVPDTQTNPVSGQTGLVRKLPDKSHLVQSRQHQKNQVRNRQRPDVQIKPCRFGKSRASQRGRNGRANRNKGGSNPSSANLRAPDEMFSSAGSCCFSAGWQAGCLRH